MSNTLNTRVNKIEADIATKLIDLILCDDFTSISRGDMDDLHRCADRSLVLDSMGHTDNDVIKVYGEDGKRIGWFLLIWGNDEDLISDNADTEYCNSLFNKMFA
jgi:hypothetical protein